MLEAKILSYLEIHLHASGIAEFEISLKLGARHTYNEVSFENKRGKVLAMCQCIWICYDLKYRFVTMRRQNLNIVVHS